MYRRVEDLDSYSFGLSANGHYSLQDSRDQERSTFTSHFRNDNKPGPHFSFLPEYLRISECVITASELPQN